MSSISDPSLLPSHLKPFVGQTSAPGMAGKSELGKVCPGDGRCLGFSLATAQPGKRQARKERSNTKFLECHLCVWHPRECLHPLPHLIFTGRACYNESHCTHIESEVQRADGAYPWSHSKRQHRARHGVICLPGSMCISFCHISLWSLVSPSVKPEGWSK